MLLLAISALGASGHLLGLGCSSDSGETPQTFVDAGPDGRVIPPPPDPCDLSKDFGPPALVPGLPTGNAKVSGAKLSTDELTIVYDDGSDIVIATRDNIASPFQKRPWLSATNTASPEYLPWINSASNELFFMRTRDGSIFDLYRARRNDTASAFGAAQNVLHLASGSVASPFLIEGRELWFTRLESDGTQGIVRAPITGDATFGAPTPVTELNDPASKNGGAILTRDGLAVYFVSTRQGAGDQDIWTATRSSESATFATPTRVAGVNSASNDSPGSISSDGCRLYFSSDRDQGNDVSDAGDGGTRETHAFVAQRPQ